MQARCQRSLCSESCRPGGRSWTRPGRRADREHPGVPRRPGGDGPVPRHGRLVPRERELAELAHVDPGGRPERYLAERNRESDVRRLCDHDHPHCNPLGRCDDRRRLPGQDGRAREGGPVIPLQYELILSAMLLCIGLYGVLARRNGIIVLMSIEIILNASILNFVAFSSYSGDASGQVFALLGIAVAAAEAAVGLAVFLSIYQTHWTIELDKIRFLKW